MSNQKPTLAIANDGALFIATTYSKDGKESVSPFHAEKAIDNKSVVQLLKSHVKASGSMRAMRQSMLAFVFASPTLDGYKGKGDTATGKTSPEYRDTVRKSEDAYLLSIRPELTGQKQVDGVWKRHGVDNCEHEFAEVCKEIVNDNNYKNIKSWVSKYFAFCGAHPVTQSGYLVPQPYMALAIQAVLNISPVENTVASKLSAILETLRGTTLDEDQTRRAEPLARELASVLKALTSHYDEIATSLNSGPASTIEAVPAAMARAIGTMQRAPVPDALV